jgi:hypothetical protein
MTALTLREAALEIKRMVYEIKDWDDDEHEDEGDEFEAAISECTKNYLLALSQDNIEFNKEALENEVMNIVLGY